MSQSKQILKHLEDGNSITPIEALSLFGCFRLAARVKDLRDEGHNIHTINEDGHAKYIMLTKDKDHNLKVLGMLAKDEAK